EGQAIPDKTLLISADQSASDVIQFARYLPQVAPYCRHLLLACPAALRPLCATLPGIAQLRDVGTVTVAEFDTYLPLGSLPRVCGRTRATIPAAVPYFDMAVLRRWKDLPPLASSRRPKVGIVWADSPPARPARPRSCPLQDFAVVLQTPGIVWYSLQTGDRRQ